MKTQTSLRLDEELITSLKTAAKKERRSLNNLIETILFKFIKTPNEETQRAIFEAENNIGLEPISDLEQYKRELIKENV